MDDYNVLITTSGLGSRLGELTNYTNKCLVRIADKPSISYIIESYPRDTKFVISLGHFGSHVRQFLTLAYPDRNFTYVEIDKYRGEGSSLGYSILKCKSELQCPFIFHASDTIIGNYNHIAPNVNYIITSRKNESSQYRTVHLNGHKLVKINEKGEMNFDLSYVGISGIYDYELFFNELEKLINSGHEDTSDVHPINNMLAHSIFYNKEIKEEDWYDIGNTTELARTKKAFKSHIEVLDKKDESIFFFDDFIIKFFADRIINSNRVTRANKLIGLVPKILSSTENFYKYKKSEGIVFSKCVTRNTFTDLLYWTKDNLWIPKPADRFKEKCFDFYITKTKKRISDYLKNDTDVKYINEQDTPDIHELIDSINTNWLCDGISSQFHGDFILDNIIKTDDGFCLIDWRQDFAGDLEIGDLYYDLAKLNHNLTINHDIVNRNLYSHDINNCYILTNSILNECKELLHSFVRCNSFDLRKVEVLTSLIWINMAPLHEYPLNNFLFNFGKYNLYLKLNS